MKCGAPPGSRLCGFVAGSCVGAALLAAAPLALAGPEGAPQRGYVEPQRLERVVPAGAGLQPMRRFDDEAATPVRRLDFSDPRGPRMTPEERRQLRRDIRDAARELYRDAPGQ